jgi:hypothetical protein
VSTPPGSAAHPASAQRPSTDRFPAAIPVDGPRARRTLWLLALGHLAIGLGAIPATLFTGPGPRDMGLPSFVLAVIVSGILAAGQVLSCLNVGALARATTDRLDTGRLARTLRRAEWTAAVPIASPIVAQTSLLSPSRAMSVLLAFLLAAVLLEGAHLVWLHRRALGDGRSPVAEQQWLPPGAGTRARALYRRSVVGCVVYGGFAALFLVATTARYAAESHGAAAASPGASVQIIAAAAVTVMPFLPIRGFLRLRDAARGDALHLPALRHAGESFLHAGAAAVVLLAVVMASTPTTPPDAIDLYARPIMASMSLVIVVSQIIEVARLGVGDIPKRLARGR